MDVEPTNLRQMRDAMSAWTTLRAMFQAFCWIYAMKNKSSSESKTGVRPGV